MNKESWKKHIEATGNIVRPSHGGDKILWTNFLNSHCQNCSECLKRKAQIRKNIAAREKNSILRELCGTSARAAKLDMGL